MSDLAPLLQRFFTDQLRRQRQASAHTIAAYRDTFTLLLGYVQQTTGHHHAQLGMAELDLRSRLITASDNLFGRSPARSCTSSTDPAR